MILIEFDVFWERLQPWAAAAAAAAAATAAGCSRGCSRVCFLIISYNIDRVSMCFGTVAAAAAVAASATAAAAVPKQKPAVY